MKHTPGPWKTSATVKGINSQGLMIESSKDNEAIAFSLGFSSDECKANAKLIAAAPDLLEASRKALIHFEHDETNLGVQEDLRQAIKKSEL